MQAGREDAIASGARPSRAGSGAAWFARGLPRRIAARIGRRPKPAVGVAHAPDAIDRAIARIKAGLPGSFAAADQAAIEAGAAYLLSLPRPVALRRIAERIYDPHGFALHAPRPRPARTMLDDLGARLAATELCDPAASSLDPVWHERRSRRIAWQECRRALIAIVHDEGLHDGDEADAPPDGDGERRRQACLATQAEQF